ncbi:MAG: pirin family protein [Sulfurovum sp.]|nr:pirin family protein [Sulfurovum sp.]NNJ44396.1 pirin family protein [Sulfurovum sp.]
MLRHIPFKSLYTADHGWLTSRFHFSFAEYHNIKNVRFGSLRVMNDDIVQPHTGFGTHPHRDMEIISYVLSGELTHVDSMGNKESLGRGAIQYLSAGTGITHSEMNDGDDAVHLIQTWIIPHAKNLEPKYGSKSFKIEERKNQWLYLVGPKGSNAHISIYQDASMYACELDDTQEIVFEVGSTRQLYVKLMEGSADINGTLFESGDAAEIMGESIIVTGINKAHILLVEMAKE